MFPPWPATKPPASAGLSPSHPPCEPNPLRRYVDYLRPDCKGERTYFLTEIAGVYGRDLTVAQVLQKMRCSCGGRPGAAWLDLWPLKVRRKDQTRTVKLDIEAGRMRWAI